MRAVTRRMLLYTEMIPVTGALGPAGPRILAFDPRERPLSLQLGGDDPARLAEAAGLAEELGYDEVDLNCGCPSARVQAGRFGVVLMKDPPAVARCVAAMREATSLPVTVKHRLGVDAVDRYEDVLRFIEVVAGAGADRFIVHARKAWLRGLSPKQNREVPPLRPEWVHRLKSEHPRLRITLNGGIRSLEEAFGHLDAGIDGVMIGRAAYDDPMIFARADARLEAREESREWPPEASLVRSSERIAALRSLLPYIEQWTDEGGRLSHVARHMVGLVHGLAGARQFRRTLVEGARDPSVGAVLVREVVDELERRVTTHEHRVAERRSSPDAFGSPA